MARSAYLKIVDATGNKIPARAYSSHYEGASYARRMNTWGTSTAGANTTLFSSLNTLRARSRQLVRNDPPGHGRNGYPGGQPGGDRHHAPVALKDPEIKAAI